MIQDNQSKKNHQGINVKGKSWAHWSIGMIIKSDKKMLKLCLVGCQSVDDLVDWSLYIIFSSKYGAFINSEFKK